MRSGRGTVADGIAGRMQPIDRDHGLVRPYGEAEQRQRIEMEEKRKSRKTQKDE